MTYELLDLSLMRKGAHEMMRNLINNLEDAVNDSDRYLRAEENIFSARDLFEGLGLMDWKDIEPYFKQHEELKKKYLERRNQNA